LGEIVEQDARRLLLSLVAQLGGEMVILDRCGAVRSASTGALALIGNYFSEPSPPPSWLPESLMRWVGEQRRSFDGDDPTALPRPLTIAGKGGTLSVRAIFDGAEAILLLEQRETSMASCVAGLPLTDRERQILVFLAAGDTNVAIAAALHISALTVKKHLEHIYEKLGVAGRVAAVARALAGPIRSFPFAIALSALFEW